MLIEFRVGNFRSFDEPQTFSFVASADTAHPDNCVPFGKQRLLKSAALFGANASGKSNLIKAIAFMRQFVLHSATTMNVGDTIPVTPFQLDANCRDKASFFEIQFVVAEVRYQYGFTATSARVHDEWLIAYPKGRARHILERRSEKADTTWTLRGELEKEGMLLKERTRENGLALSRGAELNMSPLTTVLLWFYQATSVRDLSSSPASLINETAKRLKDDAGFRERVLRLIRHADLGINDLEVSEDHPVYSFGSIPVPSGKMSPLSSVTTQSGMNITSGQLSSGTALYDVPLHVPIVSPWMFSMGPSIRSLHRSPAGEVVPFDFLEAESNGTQRFFALAGLWLDGLDQGELLVIDELDCSMHPTLTRKLLELFQTGDANPKGAQLIFSTQDSTLMDRELFRRDQLWIVEKDRQGASRLSSLYDIDEKPRNNEALQRRYLAGHYGGVPVFGPTFEDLELK
jgi:hypothetical protein